MLIVCVCVCVCVCERERERERENINIQGELDMGPVMKRSPVEFVDQRDSPHREWSLPQWSYVPQSPHCH